MLHYFSQKEKRKTAKKYLRGNPLKALKGTHVIMHLFLILLPGFLHYQTTKCIMVNYQSLNALNAFYIKIPFGPSFSALDEFLLLDYDIRASVEEGRSAGSTGERLPLDA